MTIFEPLPPAQPPMVPPVLYLPLSVKSTPEEQVVEIRELKDATNEIRDQARDAAEKFRSYAGQLERMRDDFAAHRYKGEGVFG